MPIPAGLIHRIQTLDPLPVTAQRLLEVAGDDDVTAADLADIVEYDQAVAAMVLRLANSSLFGGFSEIDSLRDAVFRIGRNALMTTVLSHGIRRLHSDAPLYDLTENDLWLHGAVASVAATEIGLECSAEVPRSAAVAALLHDVGKLIIARFLTEDFHRLIERSEQDRITFIEAERKVLGFDHAEVGGEMARKWRFPHEIARAIQEHHSLALQGGCAVTDAVILSNLVSKSLGIGLGAEGMNLEWDPMAARRLGIDFSGFCRACAATAGKVEALRDAYRLAA